MSGLPKIFVALPAMEESENLPAFLECFRRQTHTEKKLIVCINQPDEWWYKTDNLAVCLDNQKSLELLETVKDIDLKVIDKSSKGNGWTGKKYGVGHARKLIMDCIANEADEYDIIVSLDADTSYNSNYFNSVAENFKAHSNVVAMSVPYYHKLTGNKTKDRAILRYEIYMRYFAVNLWRISNLYSFTAIGSAIALPVKSYKAIGGITPHKSGEDFYFLQKLRKYGKVLTWNREKVYPAARFSDRVGFGTGPAMIKGSRGDWTSYPIYDYRYFDLVKKTTDLFPALFDRDQETPMDDFNREKFGEDSIWSALRKNFKSRDKFIRACHHKIDAFRIFQFLKWKHENAPGTDEQNLQAFMTGFYPEKWQSLEAGIRDFSFPECPIGWLDEIRDLLAEIEENFQKNDATNQTK